MKLLLVILSISVVYANSVTQKTVSGRLARQIHFSCKKKSNATVDDILIAKDGIFEESQHELGCYMNCILAAEKMLLSRPNVTPQNLFAIFPPEFITQITKDECRKLWEAPDPCIGAMRVFRCFYDKYGENIKLRDLEQ